MNSMDMWHYKTQRKRHRAWPIGILFFLIYPSHAMADEAQTDPYSYIKYEAAAGCPSQQEFLLELSQHIPGSIDVTNAGISSFSVRAGFAYDKAFAVFEYLDASGTTVVRQFEANTCKDALSAVALVAALALQGRKEQEVIPIAATEPAEEKAEKKEPTPIEQKPVKKPQKEGKNTPEERLNKSSWNLGWEAGAGIVMDSPIIPGILVKGVVFGGITWDISGSGAQVYFVYGDSGEVNQDEQSASFRFLGGRVDACPQSVLRISSWALHPCLAMEIGTLRSSGHESAEYNSEAKEKVWGAGGPLLRVRTVYHQLMFELSGGFWFPLFGTEKYYFDDATEDFSFYEIPTVGGIAGIHMGYFFGF